MTSGRDDRMWRDLQADRHKPQGPWTHWTNQGTFEIRSAVASGSLIYEMYFRGECVARSFEWSTLVQDVSEGRLDAKLGLPGKSCGLPSSVWNWNGFK